MLSACHCYGTPHFPDAMPLSSLSEYLNTRVVRPATRPHPIDLSWRHCRAPGIYTPNARRYVLIAFLRGMPLIARQALKATQLRANEYYKENHRLKGEIAELQVRLTAFTAARKSKSKTAPSSAASSDVQTEDEEKVLFDSAELGKTFSVMCRPWISQEALRKYGAGEIPLPVEDLEIVKQTLQAAPNTLEILDWAVLDLNAFIPEDFWVAMKQSGPQKAVSSCSAAWYPTDFSSQFRDGVQSQRPNTVSKAKKTRDKIFGEACLNINTKFLGSVTDRRLDPEYRRLIGWDERAQAYVNPFPPILYPRGVIDNAQALCFRGEHLAKVSLPFASSTPSTH